MSTYHDFFTIEPTDEYFLGQFIHDKTKYEPAKIPHEIPLCQLRVDKIIAHSEEFKLRFSFLPLGHRLLSPLEEGGVSHFQYGNSTVRKFPVSPNRITNKQGRFVGPKGNVHCCIGIIGLITDNNNKAQPAQLVMLRTTPDLGLIWTVFCTLIGGCRRFCFTHTLVDENSAPDNGEQVDAPIPLNGNDRTLEQGVEIHWAPSTHVTNKKVGRSPHKTHFFPLVTQLDTALTFDQHSALALYFRILAKLLFDVNIVSFFPSGTAYKLNIEKLAELTSEPILDWCEQFLPQLLVMDNMFGRQVAACFVHSRETLMKIKESV